MAIWPWAHLYKRQEQQIDDKPHFSRWLDTVSARPAVRRGRDLHAELRTATTPKDQAQSVLFRR